LRKNTKVSIFTTAQSVTCNFSKTSNGYPKHETNRANICVDTVFRQDENDVKHYQKLVYVQGDADPFKYTIADLYDDFKMGSLPMWQYSKKIKSQTADLNRNNPLFDRYT